MKFKQFLFEGAKEEILTVLNNMTDNEIHEFGEWIYSELFEYDGDDELEESEDEKITKEEIIELLGDMTSDELIYIRDMLAVDDNTENQGAHDDGNDNIGESMSRRMKSGDRNRKTRKFMGNSKADMRRSKVSRKKEARKNRAKTKKNTRINRVKKKAYNASRNKAISQGKHKVKLRKKA